MHMYKGIKSYIAGFLTAAIAFGTIGSAMAAYQRQATLDYTGIAVTMDGQLITPEDAAGNAVEPFAIEGTIYLPVRGVASALGLGVEWDQATQTVKLFSGQPGVPSVPASAEIKYYPNTIVPMLENVISSGYTHTYQAPDGGGIYEYPSSILPSLPDDGGTTYLDTYVEVLKRHGFTPNQSAAEDGIVLMHNFEKSQSVMIQAEPPGDTFGEETLVVAVFIDSPKASGTTTSNTSKTNISEGMYRVGTDIPVGTYRLTCTSEYGAYWARLKDASGNVSSIIANSNFNTTAYVTVLNGEYLQLTNCTGVLQ